MWSADTMIMLLRITLYLTAFLLVTAYALGRGGAPERTTAGIMAVGLVLTLIIMAPNTHRFAGPEYGVAMVDSLMLVAFVWLALRADRYWPLWLAAMQAVMVLCHLARIFKPVPFPVYYQDTVQLWCYPQLALLAVGTLRHRLRSGTASVAEKRVAGAAGQIGRMFGYDRRQSCEP